MNVNIFDLKANESVNNPISDGISMPISLISGYV